MVRYASVRVGLVALALSGAACGGAAPRVVARTPALGNVATVAPGLANAPRLGGDLDVRGRGYDVVANSGDSCGEGGVASGPQRRRWPACTNVERESSTIAPDFVIPPAAIEERGALVVPVAGPFYALWLCWERAQRGDGERETAQSRLGAESSTASLACASR